MFSENPAVFLRDFGRACTAGAYAFTGILNAPGEVLSLSGVNVISTEYVLEVLSADVQAGAIVSGSSITVAGQAFVVRDVLQVDDGVFSNLTLDRKSVV